MNMLGNTLEKIAFEKAGIIKTGIPIVIGEILPETQSIFERVAKEKKSPLFFATQKRKVLNWKWEKHGLEIEVAEEHKTDHKIYHLDLPGIYQTKNLLTVLETCYQFQQQGWEIDDEVINKGLKHVKKLTGLHGRWEIIHQSPLIVLDVAHNMEGIEQLTRQIEVTEHRQLHIIIGIVKDKEVEQILALLPKTAEYYFTKAQVPRAVPESELAKKAAKAELQGESFSEVNEALKAALQHAHEDDLILICGSVFLVGEVELNF
jgi:dihydrofolate synthase/folylpolyglutamate synthase